MHGTKASDFCFQLGESTCRLCNECRSCSKNRPWNKGEWSQQWSMVFISNHCCQHSPFILLLRVFSLCPFWLPVVCIYVYNVCYHVDISRCMYSFNNTATTQLNMQQVHAIKTCDSTMVPLLIHTSFTHDFLNSGSFLFKQSITHACLICMFIIKHACWEGSSVIPHTL